MPIKHYLFDLDETLYPPDCGLWPILAGRINSYMQTRLGIPREEVVEKREFYYRTYGTSLRGLQADYHVNANEYLDFVHDVPIQDYIHRDEKLRSALAGFPGEKSILTNANRRHSQRVLEALGIAEFFQRIIDVNDMEPYCKPQPEAFLKAMDMLGDQDPANYLLLDDTVRNVNAAASLGMVAILVSPQPTSQAGIQQIPSIHDFPAAFARLTVEGIL
jgi:putative hydrolase of the HAD superfamily